MAIGDLFRVEAWSNQGSVPTMSVHYLMETGAEADVLGAAGVVCEAVLDSYRELAEVLSSHWWLVQVIARKVWPGSGIPYTFIGGGAEAVEGEVNDFPVTPQSALIISHYSSQFSKPGRGRTYVPGFPSGWQFEGQLHGDKIILVQSAAEAAFEGPKSPVTASGGIWRYYVAGPVGPPSDSHQLRVCQVRPNLGTQKRRRAAPGIAT